MKNFLIKKELTVTLGDTDAAGRVFFARPAEWLHRLWEEFLESKGLPLSKMLRGPFHLPIVNLEMKYQGPLMLGDKVVARLISVEKGQKSFVTNYEIVDGVEENKIFITGKITHVCLDGNSGTSTAIPADLSLILQSPL